MRVATLGAVLGLMGLGAVATTVVAQSAPVTVRIALVSQWTINQHRAAAIPGRQRPMAAELATALDRGVVDRVVFSWQRGAIQRSSLVWKPVRVLSGPEAAALGGRGEFRLLAVQPATGAAAWTTVEVEPQTGQPGDVLVLEAGGELNTIHQVLETLLVSSAGGVLQELGLAPRALIEGAGVPVVAIPFGEPVAAKEAAAFRGAGGVEFLVARSPVDAIPNGAVTTGGVADSSPFGAGEWRQGDRVYVRAPLATLRAGAPVIVLGWKDRTYRSDPDSEMLRRTSLGVPLSH